VQGSWCDEWPDVQVSDLNLKDGSLIGLVHSWLILGWRVLGGTALIVAPMIYSLIACFAILRGRRPRVRRGPARTPALTVLKPLCGAERQLYECLRSFCVQDYRDYQIIFGVCAPDDPAIPVVRRLQREFSGRDIQLVVDARQHGTSRKVSNLMNMMARANNDHLIISDSDIKVPADYLAKVVRPLLDPSVGIVTCPYRGVPQPGLPSLLGSMFINEWFMPSVRVAAMFGSRDFAFGATIAIRRQTLAAIGGFAAIANQLADDFRLGDLTRRIGLRTVLSDVEVETCVDEGSLGGLAAHELRWLRTIRVVRPAGYGLSFVTFSLPVAAAGTLIAGIGQTGFLAPVMAMLGVTALALLMLHCNVQKPGGPALALLVIPVCDALGFALWCWSFVTRRVQWRNDLYRVTRDGTAQLVVRT
jgi:ceramide glucosyltransferase